MLYERIVSNFGQEPDSTGLSLVFFFWGGGVTLGTGLILSNALQFDQIALNHSFFKGLENLWQKTTTGFSSSVPWLSLVA